MASTNPLERAHKEIKHTPFGRHLPRRHLGAHLYRPAAGGQTPLGGWDVEGVVPVGWGLVGESDTGMLGGAIRQV